jgi:hypothetical protein
MNEVKLTNGAHMPAKGGPLEKAIDKERPGKVDRRNPGRQPWTGPYREGFIGPEEEQQQKDGQPLPRNPCRPGEVCR